MASTSRRIVTLMLAGQFSVHFLHAEQTATIPGETPACGHCSIELVKRGLLGGTKGVIFAHPGQSYAADKSGNIVATGLGDPGTISIFPANGGGTLSFGKLGRGPGELSAHSRILTGPVDSITVIDVLQRRVSILSPQARFVRSFPVSELLPIDGIWINGRGLIVSGQAYGSETIGYTYFPFEASGRSMKPYGDSGSAVRYDHAQSGPPTLYPSGRGGFWGASGNKYEISEWTASGQLRRTIRRDVAWFRPWYDQPVPGSAPRNPRIISVHEDTIHKQLWVYLDVASKRKPSTIVQPETPVIPIPGLLDETTDLAVEIIDLSSRTLYAYARFPGKYYPVRSSDLFLRLEATSSNDDLLRIYRPELRVKRHGP
jgi:hypothetical protein